MPVARNIWGAILAVSLLTCACGTDRDLIPDQQAAFANYLTGKEYAVQDGVYKYTANSDRASYATDPVIAQGDSVTFMFEAYPFTTGPQGLYYTNKKYKIETDNILNAQYWSFDPVKAKVGQTNLLKGLSVALPGCRLNDSVAMFISSDLAYGDKAVGVVPKDCAIMMVVTVTNVKKQ